MSFLLLYLLILGPTLLLTLSMGVSLETYRACIGHYHLKCLSRFGKSSYFFWSFIFVSFMTCHFLYDRVIKLSNDIEENPGPTNNNKDIPFHICHSNTRSLVAELDSNYKRLNNKPPKVIEFEAFCHDNQINILALTETWCNETHSDNLIAIDGLPKLFRRDRVGRTGGGVALYASNDINIRRLEEIEPPDSEIMCFDFQLPNKINKHVFLCVCYRPQDKDIVDFASDFLDILEFTSGKGYYNFISIGDFNCKNSEWCQTDVSNMEGRILKTVLDTNGLEQLINYPTRFDLANGRASCLDYIITNNKNFISSISSHGPIANNDHIPISFNINAVIPKSSCYYRHVWNFKKGNFEDLNRKLSDFAWDTIFRVEDLDEIVDLWTETFLRLAKECIPYTKILVRPNDLPYMTAELRSKIRKRERLFKKWKRTKINDHRAHYVECRNDTTKSLRSARENYIKSQCDSLSVDSNSGKWWDTVKKLCCFKKSSNTIAPLMDDDGLLVYDAQTKADIFNKFYAGVSTIENPNDNIPGNNVADGPLLENFTIYHDDVYKLLRKLNTSKATGPDNIGNMLLKKCAPSVTPVLTRIFNLSLSLGHFPKRWKIAHIVPIHKKGSVHNYMMYRPVSLLPCVSKVFEKLIFNKVYLHLRRNGIISEFQSGFTPGDSTINQLIHITDRILKSLDNFEDCLSCFLDLTRAFDTVWHKGLLYKLDKYGIKDHENGNKILSWFKSYLFERGHRVSIDGKVSDLRFINAAVPQGSVLGPLLFLVYINDVTHDIDSDIFLFADDTSIFKSGKDNKVSANIINSDLNKIALWAKKWKITINPSKTVSMLFSKKSNPDRNFIVKLDNDIIKLSNEHKHLGLWLSSNVSWKKHIKECACKARQRLGCLQSHKYRLNRKSIEQCYLSFVRPIMEYGSVIFDAANKEDLDILTEIEKEALRVITGARKRCIIENLYNDFKWPSLEERRELQKIATIGKIIIKRFPNYLVQDLPTYYANTRTNRRNTFAIPKSRHDYYSRSFVPASVELWNNLPIQQRCINSYKALKSQLKRKIMKNTPGFYSHGVRHLNILHTKLRLGCSDLNHDKHLIGISDTDLCICGEVETAEHFLLECGRNLVSKIKMIDSITDVFLSKGVREEVIDEMLNIELLLRGTPRLSTEDNKQIFSSVHTFIAESKRFV